MNWRDFKPGMFVTGEAEDHFQLIDDDFPGESVEYPFKFEGRIESITQRKVVIDGWWTWVGSDEDVFDPTDPKVTRGRFGIIKGGIVWMSALQPLTTWTPES